MNHALLKSVIYDQHEFIRDFQIVPRNYEFEENGNYVLVGLRRAGKSTLLYKIVLDLVASGVDWEQIIYINFEDERLSEFTVADFNDLLSVQSEMSDKKGEVRPPHGRRQGAYLHHGQQRQNAEPRDRNHAGRTLFCQAYYALCLRRVPDRLRGSPR